MDTIKRGESMKHEVVVPQRAIYKMEFNQEQDADIYPICKSVNIEVDHDNFIIVVDADCISGKYEYQWEISEKESFKELLLKEDFSVEKISKKMIFDLEKSKEETIKNLSACKGKDFQKKKRQISRIKYCTPEYYFWVVGEEIGVDWDVIERVYTYTKEERVLSEVLEKYFKPMLGQ